MPRSKQTQPTHLVESKRDLNREANILESAVDDPLVKYFRANFPNMSNQEALKAVLEIQKIVRGDASILENLDNPDINYEFQRLNQKAENMDKAEAKWNANKQGFIEDAMRIGEKNRPSPAETEKIRAKAMQEMRDAADLSRARARIKDQMLKQELENGPKEDIFVEGHPIRMKVSGAYRTVLEPEIVSIGPFRFTLQPNKMNRVPAKVAEIYKMRQLSRAESEERKAALSADNMSDMRTLENKQKAIDTKYGVTRELPPNT